MMGGEEGRKEIWERSLSCTFRRIWINNSIITTISFSIHLQAMDLRFNAVSSIGKLMLVVMDYLLTVLIMESCLTPKGVGPLIPSNGGFPFNTL
jgi:hypothetical protein